MLYLYDFLQYSLEVKLYQYQNLRLLRPVCDIFTVRVGTISVGLFATKDQEMEQRALLIKRLSFVIFSSETEQHDRLLKQIHGTPVLKIVTFALCLSIVSPN